MINAFCSPDFSINASSSLSVAHQHVISALLQLCAYRHGLHHLPSKAITLPPWRPFSTSRRNFAFTLLLKSSRMSFAISFLLIIAAGIANSISFPCNCRLARCSTQNNARSPPSHCPPCPTFWCRCCWMHQHPHQFLVVAWCASCVADESLHRSHRPRSQFAFVLFTSICLELFSYFGLRILFSDGAFSWKTHPFWMMGACWLVFVRLRGTGKSHAVYPVSAKLSRVISRLYTSTRYLRPIILFCAKCPTLSLSISYWSLSALETTGEKSEERSEQVLSLSAGESR